MTSEELLAKVAGRVLDGIMFHSELVDLFDFLGLKGFYKWQKCQYCDEVKNLSYIKHYALKKNHKFIKTEQERNYPSVIPSGWIDRSALEASSADVVNMMKIILDTYCQWEHETADYYCSLAEEAMGADKDLIHELRKEVCEEIMKVEQLKLKFQATNYNGIHIQMVSSELCEKYK